MFTFSPKGYNNWVYIGLLRGWGSPFYQPHNMKKDHFVAQNKALNGLEQLGIELGANPDTSNPMNALRSVTKAVTERVALDVQAQQMGYKSAAIALKALSQFKRCNAQSMEMLPETLQKVPNIWLSGKPEGKRTKGFVGLTVSKAMRRHRVMMPLILEVWQLIAQNQEAQDQVIYDYLRMSADDFEKELYRYIYDLEEVPLEEEFEDAVADTFDDVMNTYNHMVDPRRIYGVTNEPMPKVQHDNE